MVALALRLPSFLAFVAHSSSRARLTFFGFCWFRVSGRAPNAGRRLLDE